MLVQFAHKIELDLTAHQRTYCAKAAGTARYAHNWALSEWKRQYKNGEKPSEAALCRQLNALKHTELCWMQEVTKCAPQQAIKNLGTAYKRFFKGIAKYPRLKKKGRHDSFRADNGPADKHSHAAVVDGMTITLPRIGKIRMKEALRFNGRILSVVGCVKPHLELGERSWKCTECGAEHDRDVNAAKNLERIAQSSWVKACGAGVSRDLRVLLSAVKQEPGSPYAV